MKENFINKLDKLFNFNIPIKLIKVPIYSI